MGGRRAAGGAPVGRGPRREFDDPKPLGVAATLSTMTSRPPPPAPPSSRALPPRAEMVRALEAHDPSYEGLFLVAVRTTGVFCRPTCRPPRPPKPENVDFYATVAECLFAGYRPCRLCAPAVAPGAPPAWLAELVEAVEADPARRFGEAELRARGLTKARVRRGFLATYGVTFAAYGRARRLASAFTAIREGDGAAGASVDAGFESESGFREAFERAFGASPRDASGLHPLLVRRIETPVGGFLAGATDRGIALFEFADRRMLRRNVAAVTRRLRGPMLPGPSPHLDRLAAEVEAYFAGKRREFEVPLDPQGTPFEREVWAELCRIPYGATRSYAEVAGAIGRPTATRAVARANGANRIAILIPCHRVIGADGTLTGYGGGLWRKRLLLDLEQSARLPGL